MTILQKLLDAGIPVSEASSNETTGEYVFAEMTAEQEDIVRRIFSGFPTSVSTSSNVMIGDGVDEITLTVQGEPDTVASVSVLVGDTSTTIDVQLDASGTGIQPFSCDTTPTKITFSLGTSYCEVRAL